MTGSDPTSLGTASMETLRSDVAAFLYDEAALLDEWKLEEWLELFELGATYQVPATDRPDGNPDTDQMLIADSYAQIHARVTRLNSRNAHAENPRSRTRRLITNVRIAGLDAEGIDVTASFLVYRIKDGVVAPFIGQYRHRLAQTDEGLRFRARRAVLDTVDLAYEGRISFIL